MGSMAGMTMFPRTLLTVGAIALGAVALVFGEADDSPGLGGLGLIVAGSSIVWWIRNRNRP